MAMNRTEAQAEINACKNLLEQTDYKALKHSDGALSDDEYEPTRVQRSKLRERINRLEIEMETMPAEEPPIE